MFSALLIRSVTTPAPSRAELSRAAHACAVDAAALLEVLRLGRADSPKRRVAKHPSGRPYLAAGRSSKKTAVDSAQISVTHLKKSVAGFAAAE